MMSKLKKHIPLVILLIIALVFPNSLNYQARLNMRVIVTGLALDKQGDEYMLTAQVVKTSPGTESPGQSAEVDFVTDKASNLSEAVSKLAYKAGKVSAFSHTNFVVVGNSLYSEDVTKCLDYFIRDKIIKNSALLLFVDGSAEEELKKTKNTELSVGLGLQKVFLFKQNEGDGLMVTLIDFLNNNKMYSGSGVASVLSFHTNDEAKKGEDTASLSGSSTSSNDSSSSGEGSGSNSSGGSESSNGGGSSSSGGSGGSGGTDSQQQYFDPEAPISCFVKGKHVGDLKTEQEIDGYMLANQKAQKVQVKINGIMAGRFDGGTIEVQIKKKKNKTKIRYENGIPILDLTIKITKAEIVEIMTNKVIANLSKQEFEAVKEGLKAEVSNQINVCFEKAKSFGCDIFNAYEAAYKFQHKKTNELFETPNEFLQKLKLNVIVIADRLDY